MEKWIFMMKDLRKNRVKAFWEGYTVGWRIGGNKG